MQWTEHEFIEGQYLAVTTNKGNTYKFKEVDILQYLVATFTRKLEHKEEIKKRIMKGNHCLNALNRYLTNNNVSRGAKLKIYKRVMRPIVLYR